jgi:hypothetical protein
MTTRTVSLLTAAALSTAVAAVPAHGAGLPKTNKCGTVALKSGGKAQYIRAYKVSCTVAKSVAGRANGKRSYKANRYTCMLTTRTYLCVKSGVKGSIVFTYKKP